MVTYYRTLPVEELTTRQLSHYERLWPRIAALIVARMSPDAERLVLEGSGLWPDRAATVISPHVAAVWLTADATTLRSRICSASEFEKRTTDERILVTRFLGRTLQWLPRSAGPHR